MYKRTVNVLLLRTKLTMHICCGYLIVAEVEDEIRFGINIENHESNFHFILTFVVFSQCL
jgi:hypothetical protein